MTKGMRGISALLIICIVLALLPVGVVATDSDTAVTRYTVLILDTSGSMSGTPATVQKSAAIKFCTSVLQASGTNYVAIVKLNTSSSVGCEFSSDIETLTTYINSIPASGGTNINQALTVADSLLTNVSDSSENIIKNIVLCSDGLPESGSTSSDGPYTNDDYSEYKYANAAYNTATQMKERYNIYTLGFFHSLSGTTLEFGTRFMTDLQNAGYYQVTDAEDLEFTFGEIADDVTSAEIELSIQYTGISNDVPELPATYSSEYFSQSAYNYNHNLAWLSLCVELSSWTADADKSWGEDGDSNSSVAQERYANIEDAYAQMGFDNVEYFNYDVSLNATEDKVAYSIATKKNVNGSTLVAVMIRGGGYGAEWSSNFNVGTNDSDHNGFAKAAEAVYEEVVNCIAEIDGEVTIWSSGYSRGAAVANLFGAKMDDYSKASEKISAERIFVYTFATPQGTTNQENATADIYKNIFNIVNPGDVVPSVAPSSWGFTRYGVTKYFDTQASDSTIQSVELAHYLFKTSEYDQDGEEIEKTYDFDARSNLNQSAAITALQSIITKAFPSAEDSEKMQLVIQEFLEFTTTRQLSEDGSEWVSLDVSDFYVTLLERYGDDSLLALYYATSFLEVTGDGQLLMKALGDNEEAKDYAYLFFDLCEIHGIDSCEVVDMVMDLLTSENIENALVAWLSLDGNLAGFKDAHTFAVYLAWMAMNEEYTFGENAVASVPKTTIVSIACPVDIIVYDSDGEVVAEIDNHCLVNADIPVVLDEEATTLYLPTANTYNLVITAQDSGTMNYSITEVDTEGNIEHRVNYYDIPLNQGMTFTGDIDTSTGYYSGKYDLTCENNGDASVISCDEETSSECNVTLDVEIAGDGIAVGASKYIKGDTATLKAYPESGYSFEGWYLGDTCVSTESSYWMCLKEDTVIRAVFVALEIPYKDVLADAYYYNAVHWATYNGITEGTSDTTFSPDSSCTRAQAVTFLWRAAGEPTPTGTENPFTDVSSDQYYAQAVQWAVEQGITEGTTSTTFSPDATVTREQLITFLWRYEGKPEATATTLSFTDVNTSSYSYAAILWAAENGVTKGTTATTFSPDAPSTRAQTVTFLYRNLAK